MELKDFIKGVIFDITNAVKECQQELNNGAIIAPTGNWNNKNHIQSKELSALTVSEVSVSVGSSNEIAGKITVLSAIVAGSIGSGNTTKDENVSKVRFSIPVVLPPYHVRNAKFDVILKPV